MAMALLMKAIIALMISRGGAVQLTARSSGSLDPRRIRSKPGSPVIPRWQGTIPYQTQDPQREDWSERLLAAMSAPEDVEKSCGGFMGFGDFTFCAKVMPAETALANKHGHPYGVNVELKDGVTLANLPKGESFVGLTYGIRDRDMWSEIMSNRYNVSTELYDCFWKEDRGPMGSTDFHVGALGLQECEHLGKGICYGAKYEPKKVCVGGEAKKIEADGRSLAFETISSQLSGRSPLSVFMKMDVEGSEWEVLAQLLKSPEDVGKIRTLELEIHPLSGNHERLNEVLEERVNLIEKLHKEFAPVASNMQHIQDQFLLEIRTKVEANASYVEPEPWLHAKNGANLDSPTISYVNRQLL